MVDTPRLEELKRRVQRDPASISFAALAEEYRRLGMFPEAIETCRAGLLRHPAYTSARVTLGRALVEMGEYDEASVELEQVLQSAPENLAAIRALADIHGRRGDIPESVPAYAESFASVAVSFDEPAAASAPVVAAEAFVAAPVAVQSSPVTHDSESAALVELEAFLSAITRAKRHVASATFR